MGKLREYGSSDKSIVYGTAHCEVEEKMDIPRPSTTKGRPQNRNPLPIIVDESVCASRREPFHRVEQSLSSSVNVVIERINSKAVECGDHDDAQRMRSMSSFPPPSPTNTYQQTYPAASKPPTEVLSRLPLEMAVLEELRSSQVPDLPVLNSRPIGLRAHRDMDSCETSDSYWSQLRRNESKRYKLAQTLNRNRAIMESEWESAGTAEYEDTENPTSY